VAELSERLHAGGLPDVLNRGLARTGTMRLVIVIDQMNEDLV
jgi:hypothetical protein